MFPITYSEGQSGWHIKIDDTGLLGLELTIKDYSGQTLFYSASKLSRSEDWTDPQHGEHKAFILGQVPSIFVDTSVTGQWVLLANP